MSRRRNLAWRLNFYRQSELDGALLLGRMVRQADDPYLIRMMTDHAADEARHAAMWSRAIDKSGLGTIRIFRSYQSFYRDYGGSPSNLEEVLAITHTFEHRVEKQFAAELEADDLPAVIRQTLKKLIDEEQQHLEWIARWFENRPGSQELLTRYFEIDEQVFKGFQEYMECPWTMPGLGEEFDNLDLEASKC